MESVNVAKAYQGFVDEPIPSALFDVIESGSAKRIIHFFSIAVAFFAGAILILLINNLTPEIEDVALGTLSAEQLAISSHNTLAKDIVHPVQVRADDMSHLNEWLSYRVGTDIALEVLTAVDFTLIGANQIPDGSNPSSQVVYENAAKDRLSLFTRHYGGSTELSALSKIQFEATNALLWQNSGKQYVLVGSLSHEILEAIYRQIQR